MNRDAFICENLGLVHACARRFLGRGADYDDLYQAGCVGLVKAANGFQPNRGLQFSTYAVPLILGEIRHLFREGCAIKVSRGLKALSYKAHKEREGWISLYGREPTIKELAVKLGVSPEETAQALTAGMAPLSLTRTDEEEETQIDIPTPSPEEDITNRLAIEQLLEQLDPQDRLLLRLRYMGRQTQQATANRLGMSQVQVSRREKALLLSLREKLTV